MSVASRRLDEQMLEVAAAESGQTPEQAFLAWTRALRQGEMRQSETDEGTIGVYDPAADPLAPFLGAFEAGVPDLSQQHDMYLGQAHRDSHEPKP